MYVLVCCLHYGMLCDASDPRPPAKQRELLKLGFGPKQAPTNR